MSLISGAAPAADNFGRRDTLQRAVLARLAARGLVARAEFNASTRRG